MSLFPKKISKHSPLGFFDDRFGDLFEGFFMPVRGESDFKQLNPRIDVNEQDGIYEIKADMPGMKKDDIEITVQEGVLTISATKEDEHKEEREGELLRQERFYGRYLRQIPLGTNIDEHHVHASFVDGVLEIKVPKLAREQPKKVTVDIK